MLVRRKRASTNLTWFPQVISRTWRSKSIQAIPQSDNVRTWPLVTLSHLCCH